MAYIGRWNMDFRIAKARSGQSRSPVLSPGSNEPRRETGFVAMGHPPGRKQHGLYVVDVGDGERVPVSTRSALDRYALGGGEGPKFPCEAPRQAAG